MRCRWAPIVLSCVLLAAGCVLPADSRTVRLAGNTAAGGEGGDASSAAPTLTLTQALEDATVSTIVLAGDYSVAKELSANSKHAHPLDRNVTIQGAPGSSQLVSLDLAFRRAAYVLCPTCRVTLKDLSLRNARRGSGVALDFFVGDDNFKSTAVLLEGVFRHRLACTPGSDTTEVLETTPRSKQLPASSSGKQEWDLETVTVEGVTYPDALHLVDFTQDLPLVHMEGAGHNTARSHWGGYALSSRNVTYICEHLVSESCLADKQADACVNEMIDRVLAGQTGSSASGPSSSTLLAAVIVPIVVVGALVSGLAVWAVKRRRQRRRDAERCKLGASGFAGSFSHGGPSRLMPPAPSSNGTDSASDMHSVRSKSQGGRQSLEVAMKPSAQREGWKLVSSATSEFVQPPAGSECEVEFGAFLGAGSYGRVYRAQWAGRDVACKVIQHDKSTLAAVEAEASLMLTLHHDNVVKAFHYSTYTYADPAQSDKGGRSNRQGLVGPARASFSASQSSGGSLNPQQLGRGSCQPHSASNSGSGSSARVLLLQQQQQQPVSLIARQQSSDVLVTNLSLDDQGAQEAAVIAGSVAAATSAATTKGSVDSGASKDVSSKLHGTHSGEDQDGTLSAADGSLALKSRAETWLVQEYCDCGTLGGVASTWDMDAECDEQMVERLQLLRDTAQGLEALHQNHVVHGDINARNVLVSSTSSTPSGMCAKVADLGLARCLAQHATHRTTNSCGTMSHMAPELLRYGRLSPKVDVYAFGVMLWELFHQGQAAFDKLHYGQFFETVVLRRVRPCIPAGMPPDYQLLMQQCWAPDPADRPSVTVLKQCLQVMLEDRQARASAAAAAAAAAGQQQQPQPAQAAGVASPPGDGVLQVLQALLPQRPRGASPTGPPTPQPGLPHDAGAGAAAAAAGGSTLVSPNNSSTPLSVVSLSALFPDHTADQQPAETVLVIGEPDDSAAAAGSRAVASAGARRHAAGAATPASPLGDVESQTLDRDASAHGNQLWFV